MTVWFKGRLVPTKLSGVSILATTSLPLQPQSHSQSQTRTQTQSQPLFQSQPQLQPQSQLLERQQWQEHTTRACRLHVDLMCVPLLESTAGMSSPHLVLA